MSEVREKKSKNDFDMMLLDYTLRFLVVAFVASLIWNGLK